MLLRSVTVLAAFASVAGCSGVTSIDDDEPCKNVGYSIASRTFDCTSDRDLANSRYERFVSEFDCIAAQGGEADFVCAVSINHASCDEVDAYGDTLGNWLQREGECANILTHADGSELPRPLGGSTEIQDNEVCGRIAEAGVRRVLYCTATGTPYDGWDALDVQREAPLEVNATHQCLARWPDGLPAPLTDADACVAEIEAMDCSLASGQNAVGVIDQAAACAALIGPR